MNLQHCNIFGSVVKYISNCSTIYYHIREKNPNILVPNLPAMQSTNKTPHYPSLYLEGLNEEKNCQSCLSESDIEELKLYQELNYDKERNSILFVKLALVIIASCILMGVSFICSFNYLKTLHRPAHQDHRTFSPSILKGHSNLNSSQSTRYSSITMEPQQPMGFKKVRPIAIVHASTFIEDK